MQVFLQIFGPWGLFLSICKLLFHDRHELRNMNFLQDGKRPVLCEVEEVGVVDGEAAVGGGEGGDERGRHEPVEEVELLGAGDAGAPGEPQRQGVPRDGARRALHRRRRLRVQLPPPVPLRHPPHPPQQHRRRRSRRRAALFPEWVVRFRVGDGVDA